MRNDCQKSYTLQDMSHPLVTVGTLRKDDLLDLPFFRPVRAHDAAVRGPTLAL